MAKLEKDPMPNVFYFSDARAITKVSNESYNGINNFDSLIKQIYSNHPELVKLEQSMMYAINCEYVHKEDLSSIQLTDKDEFAFIPPVNGG